MSANNLDSTRKINARHIEVVVINDLCIQGAFQEPLRHPGCWCVMVIIGCWWLWYPADFWVVVVSVSVGSTWVRFCFPVSVLRTFQWWSSRCSQKGEALKNHPANIYDSLSQVPWGTIFERMPLPRPSHLKTGDLTINQFSPAPPFHLNLPNPSFHVNKWSIRQSLAVKTPHLYEYLSGNFPILYKLGRFQFPKNHPLH